MPYFLLCEIRTEYFAKLYFALRSAKFAFREISVHCSHAYKDAQSNSENEETNVGSIV